MAQIAHRSAVTTTSTSISTTSSSSSTSISTTSTSTSTTIDPSIGGLAHGEQNPTMGELPISWRTLTNGAGAIPEITGDPNWGIMRLETAEEGRSRVYNFVTAVARIITLTKDRYQSGTGTGTLYIRGHATTAFLQDDVTPTWEIYTVPVTKTWKYIQVRAKNAI